ncbi:hypothetical protein [Lactococcus lactis]
MLKLLLKEGWIELNEELKEIIITCTKIDSELQLLFMEIKT